MLFHQAANKAILALLGSDAKRAVVYISPKEVVSVCRRFKPRTRDTRSDFVMKFGAPNVKEALFAKLALRAGEPFPIKKVQLQPWPVKRKVK